jgi:hypothetical protein
VPKQHSFTAKSSYRRSDREPHPSKLTWHQPPLRASEQPDRSGYLHSTRKFLSPCASDWSTPGIVLRPFPPSISMPRAANACSSSTAAAAVMPTASTTWAIVTTRVAETRSRLTIGSPSGAGVARCLPRVRRLRGAAAVRRVRAMLEHDKCVSSLRQTRDMFHEDIFALSSTARDRAVDPDTDKT